MDIQLTKEQLSNLLVFLNRTNLAGNEAGVLVDIIITLQKAQQQIVQTSIKEKPKIEHKDDKK